MTTLSLRLDDNLNQELDLLCQKEGYKKSGLLIRLLREFLEKRKASPSIPIFQDFSWEGKLSLGGNAAEDADKVFDE